MSNRKLPTDDVWMPGGSPMILFTRTALSVGSSGVPIGAYSRYVIPGERQWTLIVNKDVNAGSKYDQQQDMLRTPMQIGSLSKPARRVQVVFGHIAPKRCNIRFCRAKTGVWVEFKEK